LVNISYLVVNILFVNLLNVFLAIWLEVLNLMRKDWTWGFREAVATVRMLDFSFILMLKVSPRRNRSVPGVVNLIIPILHWWMFGSINDLPVYFELIKLLLLIQVCRVPLSRASAEILLSRHVGDSWEVPFILRRCQLTSILFD
jgi:hypothetical protein